MKRLGSVTKSASSRRRLAGGALAALVCAGAIVAGPQQDEVSEQIASALAAQQQWVELRTQISKEKAALAERKLFLQDQIDIVSSQLEATREQVTKVKTSIAETTEKREALDVENEALKAGTATLAARIDALEARAMQIVARMPEPVVEIVRPLTQKFPEDPKETKLTLAQRYTYVVTVLSLIDKYNTDIHLETERRELLDGTEADVTAVYLGICEAFYVNGNGTAAGRGIPGPAGFEWTPLDAEAAAVIETAVKIYNQKETAVYTHFPVVLEGAE